MQCIDCKYYSTRKDIGEYCGFKQEPISEHESGCYEVDEELTEITAGDGWNLK